MPDEHHPSRVVWTLKVKGFVCVEPWTSPGDALNSGERLLRVGVGKRWRSFVEIAFRGTAL
jgi:galactose mutarotase-like enzyme